MAPHISAPTDGTIATSVRFFPARKHRVFPAGRMAAARRAHPALVLVVTALGVAAATGTIIHAKISPLAPVTAASAPVIRLGSAESDAAARDTVVWRDEAGAIYRAKIGGGRLDRFLRQRKATLEAARTRSRDQAAKEIPAALQPVFAEMTARVPGYADWYFGYLTKYELMGHALLPAIDYLHGRLAVASRPDQTMVQAIGAHIVAYIETQYAERVVRPRAAEMRLRAAFDKSYGALHARWRRIADEEHEAMRGFITEQAGSAERLSTEAAAGMELAGMEVDWDASRDHGSTMHEDAIVERRFRRGLLSVKLTIPKSAETSAEPDISENTAAEADEITHVIVNLFDKMVGPVVSQMGDLAIGLFAGSFAGGTTIGLGMVAAAPIATALPVGATVGLAATVVAEMLSNRLEESLNRGEFEEGLRQSVAATENAIETGMIAALHQHVEAWYADIANPIAGR